MIKSNSKKKAYKKVPIIKRLFIIVFIFFMLSGSGFAAIKFIQIRRVNNTIRQLYSDNYIDINRVMTMADYHETNDSTYIYADNTRNFNIKFDFESAKITKDIFSFDITDEYILFNETFYLKRELLEKVLNKRLLVNYPDVAIEDVEYEAHDWINLSNQLIAHAGGGYYLPDAIHRYTNSLEAITQSYNLGYRVIEVDMQLTADENIALLHSWKDAGCDEPVTAQRWKKIGLAAETPEETTPLCIEDLLNIMLINEDLFIITDMKERSPEAIVTQFQLLADKANQLNPELINRIIPQIYDVDMYDTLKSVYDFPSIIFTLYATEITDPDLVDFVKDKDDLRTITVPRKQVTPELVASLKGVNKDVFAHTVNDLNTSVALFNTGITGIYTDYITPSTINTLFKVYDN